MSNVSYYRTYRRLNIGSLHVGRNVKDQILHEAKYGKQGEEQNHEDSHTCRSQCQRSDITELSGG